MWRKIILLLLALSLPHSAPAYIHGISTASSANSQLGPQFLGGTQYMFVNQLKEGTRLSYLDGSGFALPNELDGNGYPLFGAAGLTHGGIQSSINTPSQAVRPGNYALTATGGGAVTFAVSGATASLVSCTGTATGTKCDNSACSQFTGSIAPSGSNGLLTVTVAPTGTGCSLVLGQPISNGSTFANQFGVPTIIIGKSGSANCPSCTAAGATGTYLVNWSQTIGSSAFNPGLRMEVAATANTENTTTNGLWKETINSVVSGNTIGNMAVVFAGAGGGSAGDEPLYATGQLLGVEYKARLVQGNFARLRDLNPADTNGTNITTWATRKPAAYISYAAPEMRASLYATPVSYALNGSSNDYSVNLGAALPVDKQQVCVKISNTITNSTVTFSIDNAATKHPVIDYHGLALLGGRPANGDIIGLTYDASLATWFSTTGSVNIGCLNTYMPPEAFVEMCIEAGASEWIVEPMYASDPITDYPIQYAKLIASAHPASDPIFETPDEFFTCSQVGLYASVKALAYIGVDPAWTVKDYSCGSPNSNNPDEEGKIASLLAQSIRAVSSTYKVVAGVQGVSAGSSTWNNAIRSAAYVAQNPANIPIQSGCAGASAIQTSCPTPFLQTAAYLAGVNGISPANYWLVGDAVTASGFQAEVALAYCYFYQTGSCASQASLMTTYMNSASAGCSGCISGGGSALDARYVGWYTFATTCAGGSSCTPMGIWPYEGGYAPNPQSTNQTASVTGSTNAASAVLTINPNGCVAGQAVALSSLVGGTWSTAAGNYTVQATGTDATHCAIDLNSSGLGTLTSATLTYTGSANYITYLRLQSELSPDVKTQTTAMFNVIAGTSGACAPHACSQQPSLFNLATVTALVSNQGPTAFAFDVYGYWPVATCSACTAATNQITLGGTITGIFTPGLTVLGKGFGVPTISSCTQTGSGPAGSNVGDVCTLSATVGTISAEAMTGNATPGATRNPAQQWQAYCDWNGNGAACNINWLLKRDLDPAANDNTPMFLNKAA